MERSGRKSYHETLLRYHVAFDHKNKQGESMRIHYAGRAFGIRLSALYSAIWLAFCLPASAGESCPLPPAKIRNESQAVDRAMKAIAAYKIGKLKPECMALLANKQKTGYTIDVLELHNDACGGDPITEPRAFSVEVAWNGSMKSDAYDHVNYLPLTCPKA